MDGGLRQFHIIGSIDRHVQVPYSAAIKSMKWYTETHIPLVLLEMLVPIIAHIRYQKDGGSFDMAVHTGHQPVSLATSFLSKHPT